MPVWSSSGVIVTVLVVPVDEILKVFNTDVLSDVAVRIKLSAMVSLSEIITFTTASVLGQLAAISVTGFITGSVFVPIVKVTVSKQPVVVVPVNVYCVTF